MSSEAPQRDLSSLCADFQSLVKDIDGFELNKSEPSSLAHLLKDCKLNPDELKLRLRHFLTVCHNMNAVAGPDWIHTAPTQIAAAKSEILDEVLGGLNDVFDGLPLIAHTARMSKPAQPERRAIISALTAFMTFVRDVKGYVGAKDESIKQRVMRTLKSTTILSDVRDARKKCEKRSSWRVLELS
ncbi:hypothetical protein K438DRAFT_1990070 [Mycena galopus ATCC 62051]|nr:hypothetical protein K438DRAFT_1990070 [Mycena galopus ATCC 62051]